jgi:glycosyltransferase involved in cell wall biosynthesis
VGRVNPASERRLRVVRIYYHLEVGGIERRLVDLLPRLDRKRFDVTFVCTRRPGRLAPDLERQGVPVLLYRQSSNQPFFLSAFRISRLLRRLRADIVHGHHDQLAQVATAAGRWAGTPIVIANFHNVALFERRGELRRERRQASLRDAVIHVSERARKDYLERVRPATHPGVVIHNGVETEHYADPPDDAARREILRELKIDGRRPVLLNVARLHREKGHSDLLAAFKQVRARYPEAVLVLAGEGRARDSVSEAIRQHGLADSVCMAGVRSDIRDIYHLADVNLLSSYREGFSNVVLEAMAAGVPQVLTDVGGNREAIGDSGAGVIVPPGEPAELARATLRILSDGQLARAMRSRARSRAARFSVERQVQETEQLYLSLARRMGLLP